MAIRVLILYLLCFSAEASEFYHQAPAGENEYTANFIGEYSLTRFSNDSKIEGFDGVLALQVERGFADAHAAGVIVAYGRGDFSRFGVDQRSYGLEDIELYYKGFRPLWDGSFRYGLATMIALEDRNFKSDGDRNRFTGGIWTRLYFGYEHISSPYVLGLQLSREFSIEDRIEDYESAAQKDVSGTEDMVVTFYMEKSKEQGAAYWGGSFSYTLTSNRVENGTEKENTSPILRFKVYRPMKLGSSTLIPSLGAGLSTTDRVGGAELDEYTEIRLGLGYRF